MTPPTALFSRRAVSLVLDGNDLRVDERDVVGALTCGVYAIGEASILVANEAWSPARLDKLWAAPRPPWITAMAAMTILSGPPATTRIEVDYVEPVTSDLGAVALACVYNAHYDGLDYEPIIDCFVRVIGAVFRVRLAYDETTQAWSKLVAPAENSDRSAMLGWTYRRSIEIRDGWGAWDEHGLRIVDNPRDANAAVWFGVFGVAGCNFAVVTEALSELQREQLAAAPRAPSIDVVAAATLLSPPSASNANLEVDLYDPRDADRTSLAIAVAVAAATSAVFAIQPDQFLVRIDDGQFRVTLENDPEHRTWSAMTEPTRMADVSPM
jgi:hypothetical protein